MDFYEEFVGLVDVLEAAGVDYAVCGGVALAIHGHARCTKDIDIVIQATDVEAVRGLVAGRGFVLPAEPMTFEGKTLRERRVHRLSKVAHADA